MLRAATTALAASLLFSLASAQTTPAAAGAQALLPQPASINVSLTGDIMERLITDPLLQGTVITVSAGGNGAVSLNGVVARKELSDRAAALVKLVPGVHSVTNNISVATDPFEAAKPPLPSPPPPLATAPPTSAALNGPQEKLTQALDAAPGMERVGSLIAANQVLLFGTVETDAALQQAERIAQATLPKLPVKNIIWVDAHPLSPPPLTPK